jgi:hypothetical protein
MMQINLGKSFLDYEITNSGYAKITYILSHKFGDGTKMLNQLKRKTSRPILAEVEADNRDAIKLFRKHGFKKEEEDDGVLFFVLRRKR